MNMTESGWYRVTYAPDCLAVRGFFAARSIGGRDRISESFRKAVGGDAYIAPAECTAYAEIYGEFDGSLGSMWASTPTRSLRILTKIDKTLL